MMMPANFSAISENEMTYVNGGASLADILAPSLEVKNWQKFNTNMVTIIGNSFMSNYIKNTVGVLFDGAYKPATWAAHGSPASRVLTAPATMLASASMVMSRPLATSS